jgi:hypothetical protein
MLKLDVDDWTVEDIVHLNICHRVRGSDIFLGENSLKSDTIFWEIIFIERFPLF